MRLYTITGMEMLAITMVVMILGSTFGIDHSHESESEAWWCLVCYKIEHEERKEVITTVVIEEIPND